MSEFRTFEYATINANRKDAALYADCYRSFGWESSAEREFVLANPDKVAMKLKRDRRLQNRSEVNALQRKCENALATIDALERKQSSSALTAAIILGMIGTVFMALSVFNITLLAANIPLCIIFGVLGMIGWSLGYYAYVKVKRSHAEKNAPLIDEQYDIIYNTCESAAALLS